VRRRSQITNQLHKAWSTLLMPNKNLARLSIKRLGPPPVLRAHQLDRLKVTRGVVKLVGRLEATYLGEDQLHSRATCCVG